MPTIKKKTTSKTPATLRQPDAKFVIYDSGLNAIYIEESLTAVHARMDNWAEKYPGDIGDIMVFEVLNVYRPIRQKLALGKVAELDIPRFFDNE